MATEVTSASSRPDHPKRASLIGNRLFPPLQTVLVDVKPGNTRNLINLRSHGLIPVAILTAPRCSRVALGVRRMKTIKVLRSKKLNGWTEFEAPGVKPTFPGPSGKQNAIDYSRGRLGGSQGNIHVSIMPGRR